MKTYRFIVRKSSATGDMTSSKYYDMSDPVESNLLMVRWVNAIDNFNSGLLCSIALYEMTIDDQNKQTITILQQHSKVALPPLEINLAAKHA